MPYNMSSHVLIIPYVSLCHCSQGHEGLLGLRDTALSPSQHLQVYDLLAALGSWLSRVGYHDPVCSCYGPKLA